MKTMMTKPDDAILTQWMDGELEGDALTSVDAWAQIKFLKQLGFISSWI